MKQEICKCGKIEGNSWSLHRQECKKFEAQKLVPPKRTPKKPKNQTCKCGHVKKEHRNGEVFHIVGNVGVRISKCKKFETQLVPKEKITVGTKNHSPQGETVGESSKPFHQTDATAGTLSSKGMPWCNRCSIFYCELKGHRKFNMFQDTSIKESIKKLKDFIGYTEIEIIKEIDKLVGKELI